MGKTYLVTGAAGHLGQALSIKLLEQGEDVNVFVLPSEKNIPENVKVFWGDICNRESIKSCFEKLNPEKTIVIHCAGIVSISSKLDSKMYDVNVDGTKNIVDLCKAFKMSKLVYVSSVHAIEEKSKGMVISETKEFSPDKVVGSYAKTKAEATAYVLEAAKEDLNACVVHPSGIIGPYDYGNGHMTTMVIEYCRRKLRVSVEGGYDFVDVRDVAKGIISACKKGRRGECYILSNQYYSVSELLDLLYEITKIHKVKLKIPLWVIKVIAPLSEIYCKFHNRTPLFTPYSIYTLSSNGHFSHQKATRELEYETRSMKDTLSDTIEWLRENHRI